MGWKIPTQRYSAPRQHVLKKTVHSWRSAGEEAWEGFRWKGIVIIYDNGFPRRALLSDVQHTAELWNVSSECTAGREKQSPTRKRTKSKADWRWRQHAKQWKKGISCSPIVNLVVIGWDHSHISQASEVNVDPRPPPGLTPLLSLPASAEDKMHHCAPKTVIRAGVRVGLTRKNKSSFSIWEKDTNVSTQAFQSGLSLVCVIKIAQETRGN